MWTSEVRPSTSMRTPRTTTLGLSMVTAAQASAPCGRASLLAKVMVGRGPEDFA